MNLPMNNADRLPLADNAAPMMNIALLESKVVFRPYFSEGKVAIRQPIQPPMTVKDVANDASTANIN